MSNNSAHDFVPFSKPTIDEATIQEVADSLRSGWLATGPKVQKFTQMLREYFSVPYVVPATSGTAIWHLMFRALDLKPGDEVITTPFTFVGTVNPIESVGAKPVFVDADLSTYNIDVKKIESAITPRTKAICPVHFAGLPADLDPIYALAKKYHLRVFEDAAQAIGTKYKGKLLGSFGDAQMFSFHPNKNITTGEGGCLTTSDEKLAQSVNVAKFHGINKSDAWNRFAKSGSHLYDVVDAGYKYNMLDLQAAIGVHQLPQLESFIEKRTRLANRYFEAFKGWSELTVPGQPKFDFRHNWHIFAPLINPEAAGMTRDEFIVAMKNENIGIAFHYSAVHLFSYYAKKYGYKEGDFPVAETIANRICSLPLFPLMTDQEQDRVIEAMKKVFNKR